MLSTILIHCRQWRFFHCQQCCTLQPSSIYFGTFDSDSKGFHLADVKQKMGQWWLDTVLHTPDVIIESVEFVSILSIQDGLQPGLKCVAIEIIRANPLPYIISSNSTAVFLSKSILKSPERYTLVGGSFWSIKLSSEKNKVISPLEGL